MKKEMTRNMKKFCFALFSLMLAFCMASCGDDEVEPGGGSGTTGGTMPDPVGTITLSMRNASNGDTFLDSYIHIDKDDNFEGYNWWDGTSSQCTYFASVGQVKGLGNVTGIPANGWASKIAVVPGEGVVAYADGKFYRLYVQDYVYAAGSGGVIGAEIKYQKPFGGVDEVIKFDRKDIAIDSKGGAESVLCTNSTIVPFTVTSSEGWCRVQTCSTHEHSWLVDGVHVACDENFSESARTATITVTTQTKKQTTFTVTQAGGGPIIKVMEEMSGFSAFGGEQNVGIVTNQAFSNLQINDVPSWLNAELVDNSAAVRAEQKKVRWIGNKEAGATRAASESTVKSYVLHLSTEGNPFMSGREAEIKIATKDGKLSERMMVVQDNGWFRDNNDAKTIAVKKDQGEYTARFYTSVKPETLVLKVSDSWVKAELKQQDFSESHNYGYLVYMPVSYEANPALKDRSATINIYASDGKTLVYTYTVNQQAQTFDVKEKVYLDKKGGAKTITISTSMTSWEATSSASWLTFSKNGNQITLRAEEYTGSNADRTATITFKDLGRKITVIQSKYAVGDTYSEGKITGKVVTMNDSIRLICSDNLGEAAWSTEKVLTGANSETDGMYNTNIIKAIPGYKTLYPAFALVEALNVNGATGWYMPAYGEMALNSLYVWSSTECDNNRAYRCNGRGCDYPTKTTNVPVYGYHRF